MKNRLFLMTIGFIICISSLSQTSNSTKGLSEVRLNYNLSFISQDPFTTKMGIALGTSYSFNKRFYIDAGIIIKPTRKEVHDDNGVGDWNVFRTHTHRELTAFFLDIPIHAGYKVFNIKSFSFSLSSGPRLFYLNTSHEFIRTADIQDSFYFTYTEKRNNINLGLDLGFVQKIAITDKIGLFASQHYGQALFGYSKGFESTDLGFGIIYMIK